jgi:hypothetical protein
VNCSSVVLLALRGLMHVSVQLLLCLSPTTVYDCAVHAELTYSEKAEVTLEKLLGDLARVISADSMDRSVSKEKLQAEYEAMIAKNMAASAAGAGSGDEPEVVLGRKTAADFNSIKGQDALKSVKEPMGAFNW